MAHLPRDVLADPRGRRHDPPSPQLHRRHHLGTVRRRSGSAVRGPVSGAGRAPAGHRLRRLRRGGPPQPLREPQLPRDLGLRAGRLPRRPRSVVRLDAPRRPAARACRVGGGHRDARALPCGVPRREARRHGGMGARRLDARARRRGRAAVLAGGAARHHGRARGDARPAQVADAVPHPRRPGARDHVRDGPRRRAPHALRLPPCRGDPRVPPTGMARSARHLGGAAAPRRPRTRTRGPRPAQRDR